MDYCSPSKHKVRTWELLPGYLRENQSLNQALLFQLRRLSSSHYCQWLECFWAWSSIQGPSVMPMADAYRANWDTHAHCQSILQLGPDVLDIFSPWLDQCMYEGWVILHIVLS